MQLLYFFSLVSGLSLLLHYFPWHATNLYSFKQLSTWSHMSEKKIGKSLPNNQREILTKQISYRMHLSFFFSPKNPFWELLSYISRRKELKD